MQQLEPVARPYRTRQHDVLCVTVHERPARVKQGFIASDDQVQTTLCCLLWSARHCCIKEKTTRLVYRLGNSDGGGGYSGGTVNDDQSRLQSLQQAAPTVEHIFYFR